MFSVKYTDLAEVISDLIEDISDSFRKHLEETMIQLVGFFSGSIAFIINNSNYQKIKNIDVSNINISSSAVLYILAIVVFAAIYAFVFVKRSEKGRNRFITFLVSVVFSAFCTESLISYFSIKPSLWIYCLSGFSGFPVLDTIATILIKAKDTLPQIIIDFVKGWFNKKNSN